MTFQGRWTGREPADMIGQLGRHWGWVFAYGVLTLLAGVFVLAWPGETCSPRCRTGRCPPAAGPR